MALTKIPEMAVTLETRAAEVSVARVAPPSPRRTIGMVWRRSNPLAGQLMQVAAALRQVGKPPGGG